MVRPVDFMIKGPLTLSFGCEVNSKVRSNTVWDIIVVDKDFSKFTDDFGKHITCRKGKSKVRISIYSSQDKVVSFPPRNWSRAVNLPPAYCLFIPGSDAASGVQCWSQLWAHLALSSCSQVSLGERAVHVDESMSNVHLCYHGHFVHGLVIPYETTFTLSIPWVPSVELRSLVTGTI